MSEPIQNNGQAAGAAEHRAPVGLRIIAGAKIAKGVALACLTLGVFDLIHRDLTALAQRFVQIARISPENKYVELALEKLGLVEPSTLVRLGILSAMYASIELIEGLGLWFGAAWAEYVVVVSTGLFVPEEFLGLLHHPTWLRLTLLLVNSAILAYVVYVVWNRYRHRKASVGGAAPGTAPTA
jgi:uncharacterized membrane protein (DUF2068 family)